MTGNSLEWTITLNHSNTHFESLAHSKAILSGLNELRQEEKLVDITLVAQGESFKAHRAVLAACSEYFRAMFTEPMKEANQSEIHLNGVTAQGLELFIIYAYTCKLELNRENVQDILSAASYVQVESIVSACANYLETQIDLENCVDIATIAELYSLEALKKKTYKFICSHLEEFSRTSEVNRLTWEQFEYILNCDYPVDCSEGKVLQIVLKWISTQNLSLQIARKLFDQIRFIEIPPEDLERIINETHEDQSKYYHSLIRAAPVEKRYTEDDINKRPFLAARDKILVNSRGMEKAIIKIGGFGANGITNKITYYLPSRKKWYNLTVIPHVEQCNYGTTVLGNDLYIVGGCYDVCLREYIHPFGFRYCATKNKWNTIAPMQQDRCRFSLNSVGNYLYAICGASELSDTEDSWHPDVPLSNCERYNVKTDLWEYIPGLPENRSQHAGTVHGSHIYISGGLDKNIVLSSMWRYDTNNQFWEELAPMLVPRTDHVMIQSDDKIYICGGWYEDPATANRCLASTIDVYDITKNTWSIETTIPTPRYHAGIVVLNGVIYITGGLHSDSMLDRASSIVEGYDIKNKKWTRLDRYPQHNWECTCVTLYVPRCREDMEVLPEDRTTKKCH
ncbi:unnamed protein product [Hermetia illucens]|uniref:Kelch-like protein diablo n=1 Tax=Hermetia illucens TaxID=343691 RepID=A0A7R8YYY9_HERIL|nr:kelch-like protein 9 [Hermetia illucens]CAD7091014.1 unnamed protein product [Hermetia illucens]